MHMWLVCFRSIPTLIISFILNGSFVQAKRTKEIYIVFHPSDFRTIEMIMIQCFLSSTRETRFKTREIYLAFSYTRVTRFITSILLATRLQNEGNKEQGKYISVLLSVSLAGNTHCRGSISLGQHA